MVYFETLAGAGIIALIMLYLAFNMKAEGDSDPITNNMIYGIKLFLIIGATLVLVFVPKSAIDTENTCKTISINETIDSGATNITTTMSVCPSNQVNTATSLYVAYVWFVRVFITLMFLYIMVSLILYAKRVKNG